MEREIVKSRKHGWWLYHNKAKQRLMFWENAEQKSGLLLSECPTCHAKQTRETYCKGFACNFFTLIQDLSITGIEQCCGCGQWLQVND